MPAHAEACGSFDANRTPLFHVLSGTRWIVYLKASIELGYAGSALHDPLTLATVIAPELLTLKEYYVDVDISGGVSMGKTFADILQCDQNSLRI